MITALKLENGMLTVVAAKPSPDGSYPCIGTANCSMPSWATRPALLAVIDAAIIESEAQADHQVAQVRKAAAGG